MVKILIVFSVKGRKDGTTELNPDLAETNAQIVVE